MSVCTIPATLLLTVFPADLRGRFALGALWALVIATAAGWLELPRSLAQESRQETRQARRPQRFAIIFNYGYAADNFPQDPEAFEKVVVGAKKAHFNTLLCKWEDWRGEICKKHDMQILVDLLVAENHIYKNVEAAKALCQKLRGNPVVYGYHLWSDNIGRQSAGRTRDAKNVQSWDGTHAVYVGSYRMGGIEAVDNVDLIGYYDFHWFRGGHWDHLNRASQRARAADTFFLRYCQPDPGRVGRGNWNRCGFTIATSIPFGLKGYFFHFGGGQIDKSSGHLDALGRDLKKVNGFFLPLAEELIKLGNPAAVYSTPITKTAKDRDLGRQPYIPAGSAIPSDHWFSVTSGEVLIGEFAYPQGGRALCLASHNAYQPQQVTLDLATPHRVEFFDRQHKAWVPQQGNNKQAKLTVPPAQVLLVRFTTVDSQ